MEIEVLTCKNTKDFIMNKDMKSFVLVIENKRLLGNQDIKKKKFNVNTIRGRFNGFENAVKRRN